VPRWREPIRYRGKGQERGWKSAPLIRRGCPMTKRDMTKTISEKMGITQLQAMAIVQGVLDEILDTLVQEGRIELRNFGIFEVKKRKPRQARNPRTGERVMVPAKVVVTFKPGLEMQARVGKVPTELE